ncbi:MAG: thiol:disulfide interchange protein DsbC [Campylobacterota bacterium]|nr:thiol:disulfide interchange protein DsbC [Campylobacterota bacterium]
MLLMLKLLTSIAVTTIAISANTQPDNKLLLKYVKKNIVKNPQVEAKGVSVLESKSIEALPGWTVLLTTMDLAYQGKEIHAPEMMFIKDGLITGHLINLQTGNDYRDEIKPTVPLNMYNDAHLLFGNKEAKHKILIFSDPLCPFCQEVVPDIFKTAKEHPETIAVYYYHLPLLSLHPVSGILTRVMHAAQEEGRTDIVAKMYALQIDPSETNLKKVLEAVKKQTGYEITEAQINQAKVIEAMKSDEESAGRMMVTGTPTVYIDGEWDKTRDGYKKFIK